MIKSQALPPPRAFTLAEVLITLGIIGVVAALTIPNIIGNYQKTVTVNQLKVAYSVLSNALEQAIDEYSGDGEKIYIMEDELGAGGANPALSAKYIDPYIKGAEKFMNIKDRVIKIRNITKTSEGLVQYDKFTKNFSPMCTPKGFCYWVINHTNNYTYIVVDLNGPKGPNVLGRDVFAFDIASEYVPAKGRQYITLPHHFYYYDNYDTFCNKTSESVSNGLTCASIIMTDSWQITSDYPW